MNRHQAAKRAVLIALSLVLVWAVRHDPLPYLRGPAPFPEWRWLYLAKPTLERAFPAALCAAAILGLIALSGRRARHPKRAAAALIALGIPIGAGFQVALLDLEIEGASATLVHRTADPLFTSYLSVAASPDARDPRALLERSRELRRAWARWAPHAATHPPGAVLLYRAGIELCARTPALGRALVERVRRSGVDPRTLRPPLPPPALAAALLLPWLLALAAAASAAPVACAAAGLHGDPLAAARAGLLWLLLPGPVLMLPELDQALALPVALTIAALLAGARAPAPGRAALWGARAGVAAALAKQLSYGAGALQAIGGAAALAAGFERAHAPRSARSIAAAAGAALALALILFLLPTGLLHASPLADARSALAIHRAGFTLPRDYRLWLLFNPIDFLLFLGPPLALAGLLRLDTAPPAPAARRFARAFAAGAFGLLLSGVLRGEAGRIAIPLMAPALLAFLPRPGRGDALLIGALLLLLDGALRLSWQLP